VNFDIRSETARGYLLIGVFFVHGLYEQIWWMNDWHQAPISFSLVKIIGPQISIFFLISGLSMRGIGKKSFRAVLPQSFMLIFLAWISEGLGLVIQNTLYGGYGYGMPFIRQDIKPMVEGTGGCTFVTWFFTTLAVVRILVWLFERSKLLFTLSWVLIAALVLLAKHLHLPGNLWEWRNWPIATFFVLAGMRLPSRWLVPRWLGATSLVAGLTITWLNVPGMWHQPLCFACHLNFIAEPTMGIFGFLPAFIVEEILFFLFFLYAAQNPPALIGRIGRYFGRPSLQFLLLHGWVLVGLEPAIANFLPRRENIALILAIFLLTPAVHAVLFNYLETMLNRVLASCFNAGRSLTDTCFKAVQRGDRLIPRFVQR
jgi:hypothetical protein